jgi:DNA-binding beta-propeller fold protein YncE
VITSGDPRDVVATPDLAYAYVTTDGGSVSKVRISDGQVTNIVLISGWSRNIAMSPDGKKVFVATQNSKIGNFDVATDAVREIGFGHEGPCGWEGGADETYGVTVLRDGTYGFVSDVNRDKVFMFDLKLEVEVLHGLFPALVGDEPKGISAH